MAIDVFLIRYGAWLALLLALGVCVAALGIAALYRARVSDDVRSFAPGVRRGLQGATPGERVIVRGRAVRDASAFDTDDGAAALVLAIARHEEDGDVRAPSLEIATADGAVALVGPVVIDASARARSIHPMPVEIFDQLCDAGVPMIDGDPLVERYVRAGDTILVLGRALEIASTDRVTYRDRAATLALGPDDDRALHIVGLGDARRGALRVGRAAAPLALVGLAMLLVVAPIASLYGPSLAWTHAQPEHELPYRHWLPLASPLRARALFESSEWLLRSGRWAGDRAHALELVRALREVAPDCEREALMIDTFGDDVRDGAMDGCDAAVARVVAERAWRANPASRRDALERLAIAMDRSGDPRPAELAGPFQRGERASDAECRAWDRWLLADVLLALDLRSAPMRRLRGEWLGDLAIWEAARSPRTSVVASLLDGSERDVDHDADARRTRRATELLADTWIGPDPRALASHDPYAVAEALRDAIASLPTESPLRTRIERYAHGVAFLDDRAEWSATSIARFAALAEEAGDTDAARAIARIARRVASEESDDSPARTALLARLRGNL